MCLVHGVRGQTVTESHSWSGWSGTETSLDPALSTRKQREATPLLLLSLPSALAVDRERADLSM